MRANEFLFEKRSNYQINPKVDPIDKLREIHSSNKDKIIYVVFNNIDKFGINPSSRWNTPLGIYGYPLWYVVERRIDGVPFASDAPYIYVYEIDGSANLLNLSSSNQVNEFREKLKNVLIRYYGSIDDSNYVNEPSSGEEIVDIWYHMYNVMNNNNEKKQALTSRMILVDCGYDGVIDSGSGILHENEPVQGVFFNKRKLKIIEKLNNTKSGLHRTGQDMRTTRSIRIEKLADRLYNGEQSIINNPNIINHLKNSPKIIEIYKKYYAGDINQVPIKVVSNIISNSIFLKRLESVASTMFVSDLVDTYDITQNPVVFIINATSMYMSEKFNVGIVKAVPDYLYKNTGYNAFIYSNSERYGLSIINRIKDQKHQEMFMSYNPDGILVFYINDIPVDRGNELIKLAIASDKVSPSIHDRTKLYLKDYEEYFNLSDEELRSYVLKAVNYKKEFNGILNNFKTKLDSLM